MNDHRSGPGPDVAPRWLAAVLARLAPERHRDEFLGDLAEEARSRAERDGTRGARRWLVRQLLRSAPHLLRMRLGGGAGTRPLRWGWAGLVLLIGGAQAWDSGVLDSTGPIMAMVSLGILVPAAALAVAGERARSRAMAAGCVLLFAARILSPTPLPELMLIMVFTLVAVLAVRHRENAGPQRRT